MQDGKLGRLIRNGFEHGELRFIRIYDMNLIPRRIFEQVKNQDLNIDLVYKFSDQITGTPLSLIYAIANRENEVVGVWWVTLNPLEDCIWSQVLSVDKKYQNKGITRVIKEKLITMREGLGLKKIKTITTRPKALERLGVIRSKGILMEVN